MVTGVIIDDEENNIVNLQLLLRKYKNEITICATAMNAEEGIEIIKHYTPDVVFLDIQMPGKNGFQLLQALPHLDFEVIFVTAFDQYGIQAVKFAALDYLLKPIKAEELLHALHKAIEKSLVKKQNLQLQNLVSVLKESHKNEQQRIALPSARETRFVPVQQIIHCESQNSYTLFYLINNEKILVSKAIYEYEDLLSAYGFIRCHQSHLVNRKFVKSWIKKDGDYLLLEDGTALPIARQKKSSVKNALI